MKRFLYTLCFALFCSLFWPQNGMASLPMVAVTEMQSVHPQDRKFALLVTERLTGIIHSLDLFSLVNSELLTSQLVRFNCIEESCITRFAKDAGFALVISGSVERRDKEAFIRINASSPDPPYWGACFYSYTARIPSLDDQSTSREIGYVSEEHAARFVAGMLKAYRAYIPLVLRDGKLSPDTEHTLDGEYTVFRISKTISENAAVRNFSKTGRIHLKRTAVDSTSGDVAAADFICINFEEKSRQVESFYSGRKKEIVFEGSSVEDTLFTVLLTPLCSAVMPVAAPIGYYTAGDYAGLGLWAVNFSPYLYLSFDGIWRRPRTYEKNDQQVPIRSQARYYFAVYQIAAGGMSLFADAAATRLKDARNYKDVQPLMGNTATAAYLSFVAGGAGQFYRGNRAWGYFYYHLNSILIYQMLSAYAGGAERSSSNGYYYSNGISNPKMFYRYAGILAAVKVIEVLHVIFTPDNIGNGTVDESSIDVAPAVFGNELHPQFGLSVGKKF